jgi:hypothetical protein
MVQLKALLTQLPLQILGSLRESRHSERHVPDNAFVQGSSGCDQRLFMGRCALSIENANRGMPTIC